MPDSRRHTLKAWPEYMDAIIDGTKPFECRKNDRDYRVNDELRICEWDPKTERWLKREASFTVTYVLKDFPGVAEGYAILGLRRIIYV